MVGTNGRTKGLLMDAPMDTPKGCTFEASGRDQGETRAGPDTDTGTDTGTDPDTDTDI